MKSSSLCKLHDFKPRYIHIVTHAHVLGIALAVFMIARNSYPKVLKSDNCASHCLFCTFPVFFFSQQSFSAFWPQVLSRQLSTFTTGPLRRLLNDWLKAVSQSEVLCFYLKDVDKSYQVDNSCHRCGVENTIRYYYYC